MKMALLACLLLTSSASAALLTEVKHSYTYRTTVAVVPLVVSSRTESTRKVLETLDGESYYGYYDDFVLGTENITTPGSTQFDSSNSNFAGWAANLTNPNGEVSLFTNFGEMPGNDFTLSATGLLTSSSSSSTNLVEPNPGWTTWFTDKSSEVIAHVPSYDGYTFEKIVISINSMEKIQLDATHYQLSASQSMLIYGSTTGIPEPSSLFYVGFVCLLGFRRSR